MPFIIVLHVNGDKVSKLLFDDPNKGPIKWMIKSP